MPLRYLDCPPPVGVAKALRLAGPLVGGASCIVQVASGLLGESLLPFVGRLGSTPDVLLFVHQSDAPDEHLSVSTREMLRIAEFDPRQASLGLAGVWLFGPGAVARVAKSPWRGPNDVDARILADCITAEGGSVEVLLAGAWRRFSGDAADLLELNRIALDRLEGNPRRPRVNGNKIEGRVWIHERAHVRASVVVGPAVIGPGANVADAYIGPYTSVGDGARIEGAEIERSIISPGASITHVGGRLVSSVVGREARIFRDFSLPRALRLRVGDRTEIALC